MKTITIILLSLLVIMGIIITLMIERDKYNYKRSEARRMADTGQIPSLILIENDLKNRDN